MDDTRRSFLFASAALGAGALVAACRSGANDKAKAKDDDDVGAVEDLMREHGILRRALVVYREAATRLRADAASVPPDVLQKTSKLFRTFGEDYHERAVEEAFVLPAIKRAGGPVAVYADVLAAQHKRGREIQDYILAATAAPKIGAKADELARIFDAFARMYESHAAREDTIVFPAWKKTLSKKQLDEMSDRFEEIEHQQLGKEGFEDAARQMDAIESALGLSDLAMLTAPSPPRA